MGRNKGEQKDEDDLISLVLQGKREYESVLQLNNSLRSQCHALKMECDRLKEDNESLHAGTLRSPLTPSSTAFVPNRAPCLAAQKT